MPLQWTEDLSTGVPEIDYQHRELFRRVERLLAALRDNDRAEALRLVNYLDEYVKVHFRAEEELMARLGHAGLVEHVAEHRAFQQEFERLEHSFADEGAAATLVLRLERFLGDWLATHVATMDRRIATHARG